MLQKKELRETILHLVNFNVVEVPEVKDIRVDLTLPDGQTANRVSLMVAEESGTRTQELPFETKNGRIQFTVPKLNAYAMLLIQ